MRLRSKIFTLVNAFIRHWSESSIRSRLDGALGALPGSILAFNGLRFLILQEYFEIRIIGLVTVSGHGLTLALCSFSSSLPGRVLCRGSRLGRRAPGGGIVNGGGVAVLAQLLNMLTISKKRLADIPSVFKRAPGRERYLMASKEYEYPMAFIRSVTGRSKAFPGLISSRIARRRASWETASHPRAGGMVKTKVKE